MKSNPDVAFICLKGPLPLPSHATADAPSDKEAALHLEQPSCNTARGRWRHSGLQLNTNLPIRHLQQIWASRWCSSLTGRTVQDQRRQHSPALPILPCLLLFPQPVRWPIPRVAALCSVSPRYFVSSWDDTSTRTHKVTGKIHVPCKWTLTCGA